MACPTNTKLGKDLLVRLTSTGSPAAGSPPGEVFEMASANSITISGELVDVTDKSQNGWRLAAPGAGIRSATISMSGTFKSTALESDLQTLAMSNSGGQFEIYDEDGEKYEGCFIVTSYEKSGDATTAITWSATLESASEVTYTSA